MTHCRPHCKTLTSQEKVHLSPHHTQESHWVFSFCLNIFCMKPGSLQNFPLSGNSLSSLFDHVERESFPLPARLCEASWAAVKKKKKASPSSLPVRLGHPERWDASLYSERPPCMLGNLPKVTSKVCVSYSSALCIQWARRVQACRDVWI